MSAGWLPIESVPNDGTVVMFYEPGRTAPTIARGDDWHYGRDKIGKPFAYWLEKATHWQPLPAPPTGASE